VLEAAGIFFHRHFVSADDQRTLSEHNVADKCGKLVGILHRSAVGLQMNRLVAVGPFSQNRSRKQHDNKKTGKKRFHAYLTDTLATD
jgi:hypothetical protein